MNLKTALKAAGAFISIMTLLYLMTSFALWTLDASKWDVATRGLISVVGTFLGLYVVAGVFMFNEKK